MEAIDLDLSDFTMRCRSASVSHVAASLPRGLEPGEQVVLHDRVRGYYSGFVADLAFEPEDTVYRIQIGVRLTDEEAHERLHGVPEPIGERITKQDLLDLLGRLRSSSATLPAAARRRRADKAL
ncbi:hypothetical protein [Nocardioides sp. CER19]|uniref:hypothetical protein n=1 Tax=Nocardioides sp. CER19 TaxID=3038538 RepID=UPI0024488DF6|nr:hypothetical protein [Nocardioides sp. CER19]MDH2414657.1 hypothetical protein [Nocardioides sp. CER19]